MERMRLGLQTARVWIRVYTHFTRGGRVFGSSTTRGLVFVHTCFGSLHTQTAQAELILRPGVFVRDCFHLPLPVAWEGQSVKCKPHSIKPTSLAVQHCYMYFPTRLASKIQECLALGLHKFCTQRAHILFLVNTCLGLHVSHTYRMRLHFAQRGHAFHTQYTLIIPCT